LTSPVAQPNQKAWILITKTQPIRWISVQIMMRPLATVSTLVHHHASSDKTTRRSSGKATKMAVLEQLQASRSARKRLQSSENAQRQACFAPFVGSNLHPPKLSEAQCCTRSHWSLAVASLLQWPFGCWFAVLQPCLKAITSSEQRQERIVGFRLCRLVARSKARA
jgi:hypothetical protein